MTDNARWPGATAAAAALLERADPDRAPHMRALLRALAALGCTVEAPDSVRTDYVNVARPRHAASRDRLASMNTRTGRVEFQRNAWDVVVAEGLTNANFRHVPKGNKT